MGIFRAGARQFCASAPGKIEHFLILKFQEFKTKAQQEISDLNRELMQAKHDAKLSKDQHDAYKEEMQNHEQRIEEMAVDKELAEARCEELQDEINKLKDRNEELQLELDVIKGEIELNGNFQLL